MKGFSACCIFLFSAACLSAQSDSASRGAGRAFRLVKDQIDFAHPNHFVAPDSVTVNLRRFTTAWFAYEQPQHLRDVDFGMRSIEQVEHITASRVLQTQRIGLTHTLAMASRFSMRLDAGLMLIRFEDDRAIVTLLSGDQHPQPLYWISWKQERTVAKPFLAWSGEYALIKQNVFQLSPVAGIGAFLGGWQWLPSSELRAGMCARVRLYKNVWLQADAMQSWNLASRFYDKSRVYSAGISYGLQRTVNKAVKTRKAKVTEETEEE